jgi:hypothetical protein
MAAPPAAKISASHEPALPSRTVLEDRSRQTDEERPQPRTVAADRGGRTGAQQQEPSGNAVRVPSGARIDQGDPDAGCDCDDECRRVAPGRS